jgi:hypothetical protein
LTYNPAYRRKYDEKYPIYAPEQYAKGRADETEDFRVRPVRLISFEIKETIKNGLYEPGEILSVKTVLRNFSDSAIPAKDVRLVIATAWHSVTISVGDEAVVKDLKPRTQTEISDALEFRMEEGALENNTPFTFDVKHRGTSGGQLSARVRTQFAVETAFAEYPQLLEGLERTIKLRVTNVSQATTEGGTLALKLLADSSPIQLLNPEQQIPAGSSRTQQRKPV